LMYSLSKIVVWKSSSWCTVKAPAGVSHSFVNASRRPLWRRAGRGRGAEGMPATLQRGHRHTRMALTAEALRTDRSRHLTGPTPRRTVAEPTA
jgi:hypothetical protein